MYIAHDDAQIHVNCFGQGPLSLLAIGGWTAPGEVWHDLFGHLPHWRCASLDHRGTGATLHARAPITVDDMAGDVLAVADGLDLQRCVLAAESSGAAAALRAVLRAPQRFAGLVLCGAAWKPMPAAAFQATSARLRADHAGFVSTFVDLCLPEADGAAVRHWGRQLLGRSSLEHALQLMRARVDAELPQPPERIALRTLVLHGTHDAIVPMADAEELARRMPQARLVRLPERGHAPMVTAPAELAQLIETHFCAHDLAR